MKVDTTKIPGYENMSPEDKIAALTSYEFEKPTAPDMNAGEIERLKAAVSKANSEAAEFKRQLRAKQSDDEAKAAQEAEERAAIDKELNELRKEKAISAHKAEFLSLGYDADTAAASAKALHEGDFSTVFANQKKFNELQRKEAAAGALDKQPGLTNGNPVSGRDAEESAMASLRQSFGLPTK